MKNHVKLVKNSVKSHYFALHQGGTRQIYDDEDSCRTTSDICKKHFFIYVSMGVHRNENLFL